MQEQAAAEGLTDPAEPAEDDGSPTRPSPPASSSRISARGAKGGSINDYDMILDIPVQLTVELGRTKIAIRNLLQLAHGSVVELDGLAGEPMDVLVNGTLIAQGEVVVVNDKFGIRLTDIITPPNASGNCATAARRAASRGNRAPQRPGQHRAYRPPVRRIGPMQQPALPSICSARWRLAS
jgi:flagellar motor switch protein FliN/FliY